MSDLNRNIKIYIDNSDAMSSAEKLRSKIALLEENLKSLEAQGKKDSVAYKKQRKSLDANVKSYSIYQNKIKETERILKNLSGATHQELIQTRRLLRRELEKTTRGTAEYNNKLQLYNRVQKEIIISQREMNSQYGKQASLFSKLSGGFNKYFGLVTAFVGSITGISLALRRLSQDAARMEDVYADVMKTTGLTREEVGELNEALKKMDTRTAREQLNLLARDAGKLGIESKEEILEFVEAANIINVALGEDLGDDAIKNIGKMSEVFKKSTQEIESLGLKERMLSIGSAVNEVAQNSSASEPYLVNFAARLGGVATQAGIGIDKILGYASALDQDMQAVEMSATALQKFIITIMSKPAEFARLAKLEVAEFSRLLQTDANAAIKTVLRSLGEQGGFQQLIPIFQEMGLDGARAVGVLSSMASSIDKIDEAQAIANKSMVEATSVIDEYNVKNQNAQAELEKRKKAFKDAAEELGRRLNPALLKSTNYITYLVKLLPSVLDFFARYGGVLVKTGAALVTYNLALKANAMWKRIVAAETLKLRVAMLKEQASTTVLAAKYVLASRTSAQFARSLKALFATMNLNPFALITTLVVGLGYAIWKLTKETGALLTKQNALIDISHQASKSIAGEKAELDLLYAVAKNDKVAKEERLAAIKKLNEISPEYLGNLNLENINTDNARIAVDKYTASLMENAKQKAISEKVTELYAKKMDAEKRKAEALAKKEKSQGRGDTVSFGGDLRRAYDLRKVNKELEGIEHELTLYQQIHDSFFETKKKASKSIDLDIETRKRYLESEKLALDQLKQEQADLIAQQKDRDGIFGGSSFATTSQISLLEMQIKAKEAWIKTTEKELAVKKEEAKNKGDDEGGDIVSSGGELEKDKDIYKKKLALLDAYLAEEKNKLMEARIDGKLTQQEYLYELEQLELDGLFRKMEIYKLDSEQQVAVKNLIFQKRIEFLNKIESEELRHQERLTQIQKDAEKARAENNWKNLKLIAAQNERNAKETFDKQNEKVAELVELGFEFSNELGAMVGGFISGNEDLVASSLKNIINMGLDLLKVQVQMAVASATAQSLAQPDSVATFGASGLARAAILVGLIEAAFAGVKAIVSSALSNLGGKGGTAVISDDSLTGQRVVKQRKYGKYDVIGADDGRLYSGVPYVGDAYTGVVSTPTLMGEYGGELVVNAPDFRALQRHVNYPLVLQAIQQSRQSSTVPQRAEGNYTALPPVSSSPVDNSLIEEMVMLLRYLKNNGIEATLNYFQFEQARSKIERTKNKASRK